MYLHSSPVFFFFGCMLHLVVAFPVNITAELSSNTLNLSPGTEIFYPSDPNWTTETTQRYTVHDSPSYFASVKPALESDVQKLIKFASSNNVPFLATGGGHGFSTTLGALQSGIEIDMSFFRNVTVDPDANTVTVGGGTRFGDLYEPVFDAGKEINTGASPCVGVLGATLGGGVGRYQGLHGMIIDSLLSVRIVTAEGIIVTASNKQNPDLFWAIRGAGFNYGVIVSATYQVSDLTSSSVMNADMIFPANASGAIMQYLNSFGEDMPPKLAAILLGSYSEEYGGLYFALNVVYIGPLDDGKKLLQPLLNKYTPPVQNISMVPWKDLTYRSFFAAEPSLAACVKGLNRNVYGGSIKTYDLETFENFYTGLQNFYVKYPNAQSSIFFIEHFSKKRVLATPDDATAYPYRDITAHLLWNYGYTDPALEDPVNAFGQEVRANMSATSGFDTEQIYVNYGHGDEGPVPLYSQRKLPKLRTLKKIWDPQNIFRFNYPFN